MDSIHAPEWRVNAVNDDMSASTEAVIVETQLLFSLQELGRACNADIGLLESLVQEGVLTPQGDNPEQWQFEGSTLSRARRATRLSVQLELGAAGTALVLELLEEIDMLKSELRRTRG
jgi:chaperone modulatory protein CbpM